MNLGILSFSLLIASFFFLPTLSDKCQINDRKTLISIRSAMGNPYISWGDPEQTSDCCDWVGISCDEIGRVIGLDLFGYSVSGQISPSIGDLPYLTSLTFNKLTNLTGNIPNSITKLTSLTFLRLDWNSLSGPFPSFLSQLTNLNYLNLAFNQFSGSIPSSLGALPLRYIRLDGNKLTGPIPESIASIPNAEYLYLSQNSLSGTVPTTFSKTTLSVIDLSRNNLNGDALVFFGEDKPLTNLNLSWNMFEFNLSKVKLPENMDTLDLNHNQIYGGIPSSFANIVPVFWNSFNVSYNRLCGEIPTGTSFTAFGGFVASQFFHNRCLCGAPLSPCKSPSTNS